MQASYITGAANHVFLAVADWWLGIPWRGYVRAVLQPERDIFPIVQ